MERPLLDRLFRELFSSEYLASEITVVWHSGEPLTQPVAYYDEAIDLILGLRDALAPGKVSVKFDIQTNGVLIDEQWCRFFKRREGDLALGISCDGPSHLHDLYRRSWNNRSSHAQTVRGMDLLQRSGLKYKIIAVVTNRTLREPEGFYDFFFDRRHHLTGFHFNILAGGSSADPELSYAAGDRSAYYAFYRSLLKLGRERHRQGYAFDIQNFSRGMTRILNSNATGSTPYLNEASAPLKALNIDARGNVTTFYAGLAIDVLRDAYEDGTGLGLGNVLDTPLREMVRSPKLQRIMQDFAASSRSCESACEYFPVCSGGFELTKKQSFGTFQATETAECVVHVKTLVDALLDDVVDHLEDQPVLS
jgi:uncharacterized protein